MCKGAIKLLNTLKIIVRCKLVIFSATEAIANYITNNYRERCNSK